MILDRVKYAVKVIIFYVLRIFPLKDNKIVISMYDGKEYGNEGQSIVEAMAEDKYKYDIVWLVKDYNANMPENIRIVRLGSMQSYYELITAKVWIDNIRKASFYRKRKRQYYIHTWHGGGPCIKKVEKDAEEMLSSTYVQSAKNDSKMANVMVSGCEWRTKNMRFAFWYDGEILKCDLEKVGGNPIDEEKARKRVEKLLHIDRGTRLLLYAPTFRDDHNTDCYGMDYESVLFTLKETYGGDWNIIVRLHPNVSEKVSDIPYCPKILNGSNYPNITDLILSAEYLVTDYSGVMFDGFRRGCRVVLFALDYENYLENERGMYFDITKLPAPFTESNLDLCNAIQMFDDDKYEAERKMFVDEIGYYDNHGAEVVAERIKEIVFGSDDERIREC